MSARNYSSTAIETTLTSSVTDSATSIVVASLTGYPSAPFTIIVDENTAAEEVMTVTAIAGLTLTVTRGVDGTVAASHSTGAVVRHGVSARDFREPNQHINATGAVHSIANVTNLQATLDGKAASVHTHTISNVTDLQTALDGKAATTHNHDSTYATVGHTHAFVSQTNGTVTTASTSSTVVRNITVSTSDPTGGSDGDVWLKYV